MNKQRVGVLGASGTLGEKYLSLLKGHPWFELAFVSASQSSSHLPYPAPFVPLEQVSEQKPMLLFSALPTPLAKSIEPKLVKRGFKVISSASAHRAEPDVPLIIPEINAHHLTSLPKKGGFLVAKPNCAIQSFLLPLAPLHRTFILKTLSVTTLQAMSGAGKNGINPEEIKENLIPYIEGEEEKVMGEPHKILAPASFKTSAHCIRVPVEDGHMALVSASFEKVPSKEQILMAWEHFSSLPLPSAPARLIRYFEEQNRPQPKFDRDFENGMGISVGRLRACPLFDWSFCALSHNTIRGGAGGGILTAELLYKEGYLG